MNEVLAPFRQPNEKLLRRLIIIQRVCLVGVVILAGGILCGWVVPVIGSLFPRGWTLMKANTALSFLLSISGLILVHKPVLNHILPWIGLCAAIILWLSGTALLGYLTDHTYWVETMLAADSHAELPGRMAVQTAAYFMLTGLILALSGPGYKLWNPLLDIMVLALFIIILIVFAGYSFDASYLFGHSPYTRTSPQTLVCMALVGLTLFIYRCRSGLFDVFVGPDIGSRIVRSLAPFALVLPFLIVGAGAYAMYNGWLTPPYVAAISAALSSALAFIIIMLMGRKINEQEQELRDISLTDELTRIYNRRAFYMLGEHALKEIRRTPKFLSVLFFDIDGLKKVNDAFGHDTGSRLLQVFADMLRDNFRSNDIIARLGGDEFAIITDTGKDEIEIVLGRLQDAANTINQKGDKPYRINYTVGVAGVDHATNETFSELVSKADAAMYQRKHDKQRYKNRKLPGKGSVG